jgi:hypothetical protein
MARGGLQMRANDDSKTKYIKRSLTRSMECVDRNDLREALKNLIVACGYQVDETERLKEQLRIDGELFIADDGEIIATQLVTNGTNASNTIDNA